MDFLNIVKRWYNQNRKLIFIVIGTILFVLLIIRVLNNYAKTKKNDITITSSSSDSSNYAVISSREINKTQQNDMIKTIRDFIEYCNNSDLENAYNLLSKECKDYMYPTQNDFEEKYYKKYFSTKKSYYIQAWIDSKEKTVYQISFQNDILATGNPNGEESVDYYTLIQEDGMDKLNINRYIGHEEINKEAIERDINITILSRDVFLDNVKYNFKIVNNSDNDILLDNFMSSNSILLLDNSYVQYHAATLELNINHLLVYSHFTRYFTINFLKSFNTENYDNLIFFRAANLHYGVEDKLETIALSIL